MSISRIARVSLGGLNLNLRSIDYLAFNWEFIFSQVKSIMATQIVTVMFNNIKS